MNKSFKRNWPTANFRKFQIGYLNSFIPLYFINRIEIKKSVNKLYLPFFSLELTTGQIQFKLHHWQIVETNVNNMSHVQFMT
jgi:hypothetical protein